MIVFLIYWIAMPMFFLGVFLMIFTQSKYYEKGIMPFLLSSILTLIGLFMTTFLILTDLRT